MMKIKNPARHLPHYVARVYLLDGTWFNKRGSSQPEIDLPVDEDACLTIVFECLDAGQVSVVKLLRVEGTWIDFSDAALAEVLAPKPEPKPEPAPDPVPATKEERRRYEEQNSEIENKPKPKRKPKTKPAAKRVGVDPANSHGTKSRRPTN
jgi:hypothetical protein